MPNTINIIKSYENRLYNELLAYIQSNMDLESQEKRNTKNSSSVIRSFNTQTGLMPSFEKGNINNIFMQNGIFDFVYGSKLPYAAIHEFGGEFTQNITAKQRAFFWWKNYETKDNVYKYMALSTKLNIKIPARPYFYKAVNEWEKERLSDFTLELIDSIIKDFESGD